MMSLQRSMHSSQMYTVGPAMSFRTSSWLFPQNEQTRLPVRSSPCFAIEAPLRLGELARPGHDDLVDEAVLDRLLPREEEVAVGVLLDSLEALTRVLHEDVVHLLAEPDDLARLDVDVRRLPLHPAERLMDHDPRVRQREALPLRAGCQKPRRHARRLPHAERRDLRLDVLHGVVDREAGGHRAARRIDVHVDVLLRVLGLEEEQLRDHQVREVITDRRTEDDDAIAKKPRVDVVGTLSASRLLDDDGNEIGVHDAVRSSNPLGIVAGLLFMGNAFLRRWRHESCSSNQLGEGAIPYQLRAQRLARLGALVQRADALDHLPL